MTAPVEGGSRSVLQGTALTLAAVVAVMNWMGIQVSARVQLGIAAVIATLLLVAIVVSLPRVDVDNLTPFLTHGWSGVGAAAALLVWAFAGWEIVSSLSAEYRDPRRDIGRATATTLAVVTVLYLGIAFVTVAVLPLATGLAGLCWTLLRPASASLTVALPVPVPSSGGTTATRVTRRSRCAHRSTTRTSPCACTPLAGLPGGSPGASTASGSSPANPSPGPLRASGSTHASAAAQTGEAAYSENDLEERRLTLFAGPVLHPADPPYRGIVQLPVEHWKVVVYRIDGQLRFKSFVLTQDLDDLERARPDFLDDFDTYLVPLELLAERTGLTFASLREHAPPRDLQQWNPVLVEDADQVNW